MYSFILMQKSLSFFHYIKH